MKKIVALLALATMTFIAGCSTIDSDPVTPKQHPEKYALQIVRIEAPVSGNKSFDKKESWGAQASVEQLLQNPKAIITEFPIVYATVGETAIHNQTQSAPAPKSYQTITTTNGIVDIIYSDETVKVGTYIEWALNNANNGIINSKLWLYENNPAGHQNESIAPATNTHKAINAELPIFKKTEIKTTLVLQPGTWLELGGVIDNDDYNVRIKKALYVRTLPPLNEESR